MACGMVIGRFPFSVWVTSTDTIWFPVGKPLVIVGSRSIDYALTINQLTGNASAIPATALMAARPEVIASVTAASGSYSASAQTTHHSTDTSAVTDKFLAGFGVLGKLSAAGNASYVSGYLSVIHRACGTVIGSREIEVDPYMTTAAPKYYLLGRVPASGGDKFRAAVIGNAMNDVDFLVYVRGVNDPDNPGSWVALNAGTWTAISNGSNITCIADLSVSGVTPANYHMLEFGLALRQKSGGGTPAGFIKITSGLSYT